MSHLPSFLSFSLTLDTDFTFVVTLLLLKARQVDLDFDKNGILVLFRISHSVHTPHCRRHFVLVQSLPTIYTSHQFLEEIPRFEALLKMLGRVNDF